jgi:hypothetical protein
MWNRKKAWSSYLGYRGSIRNKRKEKHKEQHYLGVPSNLPMLLMVEYFGRGEPAFVYLYP